MVRPLLRLGPTKVAVEPHVVRRKIFISERPGVLRPWAPSLLAGASRSAPPADNEGEMGRWADRPRERISDSETRVLRYLPTNLSAPEIAAELTVSVSTVRTHLRRLYEKLGAHSRTEAVERARALGLLAPSPRRP
jgi:DNA-binding NarL/FixJ family response regulator